MTATIFPVGHYTGLRTDDDGRSVHTVRTGSRHHRLTEEMFGTWVLAHGLPGGGRSAWTEDDVRRRAEEVQIPDVAGQLAALTAIDLVAAVDDEVRFARTHRMEVYFVGFGNSPEDLDQFAVGVPGLGTAAILDSASYQLWQWGSVAPTLWHSCELRAASTSRSGRAVSAHDVTAEVLGDLRVLVAGGCAYLDVVPE